MKKMRMKRCLCFYLNHGMHPASVYMLLKGKAALCGGWPSCFSLPRNMWGAASEGEWDGHHPAAL